MTTKRQLTISRKLELIEYAAANPMKSQEEFVTWVEKKFGATLDRSTISKILKNKGKIINSANRLSVTRTRFREVTFPEVDIDLFDWVIKNQGRMPISEAVLVEQATYIAHRIKALPETKHMTRGWIMSFKKRHDIRQRAVCGEAGTVDPNVINLALPELQQRISVFSPRDVFNFDKTSLFYRLEPNKTLATKPVMGRKKDLERLTIGLCTNALGTEKLNPIVIGKYGRPRCFKNINNTNNLGIIYRHNKSAWMTGTIFKQWITNVDNDISMKTHGRRILLIIDNATCHIIPEIELQSIDILFLPPKTNSLLQPLDAGIIAAFKTKYRSMFIRNLLEQKRQSDFGLPKLNILQAITFITSSWDGITSTTIHNCWAHTGLISRDALRLIARSNDELVIDENQPALVNESEQLQHLINDLTGENELDVHTYLNIESQILHDEDNSLSSMSSDDNAVDKDVKKPEIPPISYSEVYQATQVIMTYLQQQPENQSEWIRDLKRLQKEIERQKTRNIRQSSILDFFNKN